MLYQSATGQLETEPYNESRQPHGRLWEIFSLRTFKSCVFPLFVSPLCLFYSLFFLFDLFVSFVSPHFIPTWLDFLLPDGLKINTHSRIFKKMQSKGELWINPAFTMTVCFSLQIHLLFSGWCGASVQTAGQGLERRDDGADLHKWRIYKAWMALCAYLRFCRTAKVISWVYSSCAGCGLMHVCPCVLGFCTGMNYMCWAQLLASVYKPLSEGWSDGRCASFFFLSHFVLMTHLSQGS